MIVPEILLLRDYAGTRRLLLDALPVESILECGHRFDGVHMGAVVVVAGRAPRADQVSFRVPDRTGWAEASRVSRLALASQPEARFNRLLDDTCCAFLEALRAACRPLGDVVSFREGIHSGNARALLFPAEPGPEREPLVVRHRPDGTLRLPGDGRYFDHAAWRGLRRPHYAHCGDLARHQGPRLLLPRTTARLTAYLERDRRLVSNNFFVGTAPAELLPVAWAWLNSELASLVWRLQFPRSVRLFPEVKINHLAALPLPALDPEACAALADLSGSAEDVRGHCDALVAAALPPGVVAAVPAIRARLGTLAP